MSVGRLFSVVRSYDLTIIFEQPDFFPVGARLQRAAAPKVFVTFK
jgi:hypothetical protein